MQVTQCSEEDYGYDGPSSARALQLPTASGCLCACSEQYVLARAPAASTKGRRLVATCQAASVSLTVLSGADLYVNLNVNLRNDNRHRTGLVGQS